MVVVGRYGAFRVNGLGLANAPFPLTFSVADADGVWSVSASAAQAAELADVLVRSAGDTVLVVDLATSSFCPRDDIGIPSLIAAEQGVDHEAHDLGFLATGVGGLTDEALVLRSADLGRFLDGWSPYVFALVDVPGVPTPDRVDEIALAVGTTASDDLVLPALAGSRLVFFGHDDCYVAIESTDPSLPAAVLTRLLALLVGSVLVDEEPVEVREPDRAIAESLIEEGPHWIGLVGAVSEHDVRIDLRTSPERWRFDRAVSDRVDRTVVHDLTTGEWRMSPS